MAARGKLKASNCHFKVDFTHVMSMLFFRLWNVSRHVGHRVLIGWPTAVLHWQALCPHVPAKAASWRTVVVDPFLRWGPVHPPEWHEDNDRIASSLWPSREIMSTAHHCMKNSVTYAVCSCVEIHTMTPAVSCNKKHCIMGLQAHLCHFGFVFMIAMQFSVCF